MITIKEKHERKIVRKTAVKFTIIIFTASSTKTTLEREQGAGEEERDKRRHHQLHGVTQ